MSSNVRRERVKRAQKLGRAIGIKPTGLRVLCVSAGGPKLIELPGHQIDTDGGLLVIAVGNGLAREWGVQEVRACKVGDIVKMSPMNTAVQIIENRNEKALLIDEHQIAAVIDVSEYLPEVDDSISETTETSTAEG